MVKYGTKPISHNLNTLPKWARTYILTGGAEGKLGKINSLPQWARLDILAIKSYQANCRKAEKDQRKENCKGCRYVGKCSPKRRATCDELRDIPPCG